MMPVFDKRPSFLSQLAVRYCLVTIFSLMIICGASTAWAETSRVNVSQGYKAAGPLAEGSLVATDAHNAGVVVAAGTPNVDSLVGVIVQANESAVAVNSEAENIQVATSGEAYTLVSNINGEVKTGDHITASSIVGVGMKATESGRTLGVSRSDLAKAADIQTVQVKDDQGKPKSIKVGRVLVLVDISSYAGPASIIRSVIPSPLQNVGNVVAGKAVSPVRILSSVTLLIMALLVSIFLVNGAVRSSIVSIGRNPLARPAIRRGLSQVLIFVAVILLVTLLSVYLILSR